MKNIKTIQPLNLKDGGHIPQGSTIQFVRHSESDHIGVFSYNGRELEMQYRKVIKNPSDRSLEKWTIDSVCKSVFGNNVEPDGYGPEGEPSWLLAVGLI